MISDEPNEKYFTVSNREALPEYLRWVSFQTLNTLELMVHLKARPHLYWDRDGHGRRSFKIRYRAPAGRWWVRDIGPVKWWDESVLRVHREMRWPEEPLTRNRELLIKLRVMRSDCRAKSRKCEAACGWSSRGYRLHTGTTKRSQRLVVPDQKAVRDLAAWYGKINGITADMLKIVDGLLNDPKTTPSPRQRKRLTSTRNALIKALRHSEASEKLALRAWDDPRNANKPNSQNPSC